MRALIFYAQALLATDHADAARQQLEDALGQTEEWACWWSAPVPSICWATLSTLTGKPKEAPLIIAEAARSCSPSVSKEKRAAHILDRPDLKDIYSKAKSSEGGAA